MKVRDKKVQKMTKDGLVEENLTDKSSVRVSNRVGDEMCIRDRFMQLQKYNSVVAGLHEYYCISTEVSHDLSLIHI